ncbi:hypothetical protein RFI_28460 [Reticulomyxa filosa]|uniref:Uncharacterized protein n=1 Tax=Reticulomyxa filosa TaxID=46433 RepID=X6M5N9_RETFI|nr:hypothetical protein RFI_28460 [Reticulomyxa filosa]|eukprot:ETO08926.1 hypothetical protein RFI_28460 [Reticulomyxa filosa]
MIHEFGRKGRIYWWLDIFLKDQIDQVALNGIGRIFKSSIVDIYTSDEKQMEMQLSLMQKVCIKFHCGHKNEKYEIEIEEVYHVKYLCLIIDQQMTFQQHINYVYSKALKKLGYLTLLRSYKGIRPILSMYNPRNHPMIICELRHPSSIKIRSTKSKWQGERVLILSDFKFAVDAIYNNSKIYNFPIA